MASTTTVEPGRAAAAEPRVQAKRKGINWGTVRSYAGITLIVLFCLAPFYWMIVTSFRDVGYTFDNTPWPCLLYTSPSPRDRQKSRMPSSA